MLCLVIQSCPTLCNPMDCSPPDSFVHGDFPGRQEYWSGLPCPSPGNNLNPGIEPRSPALQADSLPSEPQREAFLQHEFRSVVQSCPTLCDPMDCSMPGFPVLHHLPELTQTHVHWVGNVIQPSHLLSSHHLIFCHPLSFYLQSFPAAGSFQISQFFASGSQILEFQL